MRMISKMLFLAKKNAPTILLIAGGACFIGTIVATYRGTKKSQQVMKEFEIGKELINNEPEETRPILKKEVYTTATLGLVKSFAPAIGLAATSITCVLISHRILTSRHLAALAAFDTVSTAFSNYRQSVVEEVGEEKEQTIMRNALNKQSVNSTLDGVIKEDDAFKNGCNKYSPYSRIFDAVNSPTCWSNDAFTNRMFLQQTERYLNQKLRASGHLFLNEVYDALGLCHTQPGALVGWIYNPSEDCGEECDEYISFGLDPMDPDQKDFMDGIDPNIVLDFNVDGVIWDLI